MNFKKAGTALLGVVMCATGAVAGPNDIVKTGMSGRGYSYRDQVTGDTYRADVISSRGSEVTKVLVSYTSADGGAKYRIVYSEDKEGNHPAQEGEQTIEGLGGSVSVDVKKSLLRVATQTVDQVNHPVDDVNRPVVPGVGTNPLQHTP